MDAMPAVRCLKADRRAVSRGRGRTVAWQGDHEAWHGVAPE